MCRKGFTARRVFASAATAPCASIFSNVSPISSARLSPIAPAHARRSAAGSADGDGFVVTVDMTSLAGCSGEAFASILRSLGYATRSGPARPSPSHLCPRRQIQRSKTPYSVQDEPAQTASAPVRTQPKRSEAAETASTSHRRRASARRSGKASEITTPVEAAVETQPQETQSQETQSQRGVGRRRIGRSVAG